MRSLTSSRLDDFSNIVTCLCFKKSLKLVLFCNDNNIFRGQLGIWGGGEFLHLKYPR